MHQIPIMVENRGQTVSPAPRSAPARINWVDCKGCMMATIFRAPAAMSATSGSLVYILAICLPKKKNKVAIEAATIIPKRRVSNPHFSAISGLLAPRLWPTNVVAAILKAWLGAKERPTTFRAI